MELIPYSLPNVFTTTDMKRVYTKNLVEGVSVYNEDLIKFESSEFRYWNPRRSKLAALILKRSEKLDLRNNDSVLYLGASTGTTSSHVSDILPGGRIFCVEFSDRPFRDLVNLCKVRPNMIPILANARKPIEYKTLVAPVDWLYQDISQRDQVEIFIKNINMYLKKDGRALLMLKSRSVDVNASPDNIYKNVHSQLESGGLKVLEMKDLSPLQKDHASFIVIKI